MKKSQLIPGISESYSKAILNIFGILPQGSVVLLFGSRAKGNYREGSDIDFAIKCSGFTPELKSLIIDSYDELYLPWKIDLIHYDGIQEPTLEDHINRCGIVVFRN